MGKKEAAKEYVKNMCTQVGVCVGAYVCTQMSVWTLDPAVNSECLRGVGL